MSSAIVQPGQTLEDIAIQYLGDEQGVFELAQLNNIGLTSDLTSGQKLILPEVVEKRIRKVYEQKGYEPAVGDEQKLEGIDYWVIGVDFEVQ